MSALGNAEERRKEPAAAYVPARLHVCEAARWYLSCFYEWWTTGGASRSIYHLVRKQSGDWWNWELPVLERPERGSRPALRMFLEEGGKAEPLMTR
jgi:hypothetical protein